MDFRARVQTLFTTRDTCFLDDGLVKVNALEGSLQSRKIDSPDVPEIVDVEDEASVAQNLCSQATGKRH